MYRVKSPDIFASDIAGFLEAKLVGDDFIVKMPSSRYKPEDRSLTYFDKGTDPEVSVLDGLTDVLVLTSEGDLPGPSGVSFLTVDNPKVAFIDAVNEFFIENEPTRISERAHIDDRAVIGTGVSIGGNSAIGPDVTVGDNTKILNNVVIDGRVDIGCGCFVKHNSTIGSIGYHFENDGSGRLLHFPHIGRISIGNNVWIGANTCIETPPIDKTDIFDDVKIDDLVQVGAGTSICEGSMITAGVIISRDVSIGRDCLIAPNVTVRDSVTIGDDVTVGLGAVVLKDLEAQGVYVGNPAVLLRKRG